MNIVEPGALAGDGGFEPPDAHATLELADWRRRVASLYAEVRELAATSPERAWDHWRGVREALYREHPQSPVPVAERHDFRARHWPYDGRLRFEVGLAGGPGSDGDPAPPPAIPMSAGASAPAFTRLGEVTIPLAGGRRTLVLLWLQGYAGGLFLPFRDATNGRETYGAGRYLLDAAKSADLGGDVERGTLVVDFNFAYHPSCAFDPRWACPLAPPENRFDFAVEAGERLA